MPLHARRAVHGLSATELVERLLAARDSVEMHPIAERLAVIGDDDTIDRVLPLVDDRRGGVASVVIDMIGNIGSEHAADVLISLAKDPPEGLFDNVVRALGATGSPRARTFLLALIEHTVTHGMIQAVAQFPDAEGAAAIARVAARPSDLGSYAMATLGGMQTEASRAALRSLLDSPSVNVVNNAMSYLDTIDEATLHTLISIVHDGDARLARGAVATLGRAGEAAAPLLVELAREGRRDLREAAIDALATIPSELALETLTEIAEVDDGPLVSEALAALVRLDMPGARDVVISIAMSERAVAESAVAALANAAGEDVDSALLVIAKSNGHGARDAIDTLLERGNADALALVSAAARAGSEEERLRAVTSLQRAGTAAASAVLLELARSERGPVQHGALANLAANRHADPAVVALLRESLRSTDPELARIAARGLSDAGTEEARDALVGALTSGDADLQIYALGALEGYRLDDATGAVVARVAEGNPAIESTVMARLLVAGSPHGVQLAEAALQSGDRERAAGVLHALEGVSTPAASKLLEEAVHATEGDVRAYAVRALGETGDRRAIDVLKSALDDPDPGVRESVAGAFATIGGDEGRAALVDLTRSHDANDRLAALQYLREQDHPIAQQRVVELLRDPEPSVVEYAISTVGDSPRAVSELRALAGDAGRADPLRYRAARELEARGQLDPSTEAWLESYEEPAYDPGPAYDDGIYGGLLQ